MSLFKSHCTSQAEARLEKEIHDLMHTLEHLKTSASHDTRRSYEELRERAADLLQQTRCQERKTCHGLSRHCQQVGHCACRCVHAHPWASLAVGVGAAAALLGLLFSRSRDH